MTNPAPRRIRRPVFPKQKWALPPNSVFVGRPSIFSNPTESVFWYEDWLNGTREFYRHHGSGLMGQLGRRRQKILDRLPELRGKDLVCWCPTDRPCRSGCPADYLLLRVNQSTERKDTP